MKDLNWKDKRTIRFFGQGKEKGLILIGDSEKPSYKFYQFEKCKHIEEKQQSHVRNNNISCVTCKDELNRDKQREYLLAENEK